MPTLLDRPQVLIIEDDQDLLDELVRILDQAGMEPFPAQRSTNALSMVKNQRFACILTDLHMQGASGLQIIQTIRGNRGHPNHATPIIIVSAYIDPKMLITLKGQISAAIAKPFDSAHLVKQVYAALGIQANDLK